MILKNSVDLFKKTHRSTTDENAFSFKFGKTNESRALSIAGYCLIVCTITKN